MLSDVQYADTEDAWNYYQTAQRYYRHALVALRNCIAYWQTQDICFVVNLGDVIDGKNAPDCSVQALKIVQCEFDKLHVPVLHCIGNHELYNFNRQQLAKEWFNMPATKGFYTTHVPKPGFKIIVLDTYGYSTLGSENPNDTLKAVNMLQDVNPNADKNSSDGLSGTMKRFVSYNGGIDPMQLRWFKNELKHADANLEKVIVCTHVPILPTIAPPSCLLWNYEEMLQVLQASKSVVAVLTGHAHQAGYGVDESGIHHMILDAMLESESDAFCIIDVYPDSLHVQGHGSVVSRIMKFRQ